MFTKRSLNIILLSITLVALIALPVYAVPGAQENVNLSYGADSYSGSDSTVNDIIFVSFGPVKNLDTYDSIINRIELTNIDRGADQRTYYYSISSNINDGPN